MHFFIIRKYLICLHLTQTFIFVIYCRISSSYSNYQKNCQCTGNSQHSYTFYSVSSGIFEFLKIFSYFLIITIWYLRLRICQLRFYIQIQFIFHFYLLICTVCHCSQKLLLYSASNISFNFSLALANRDLTVPSGIFKILEISLVENSCS